MSVKQEIKFALYLGRRQIDGIKPGKLQLKTIMTIMRNALKQLAGYTLLDSFLLLFQPTKTCHMIMCIIGPQSLNNFDFNTELNDQDDHFGCYCASLLQTEVKTEGNGNDKGAA